MQALLQAWLLHLRKAKRKKNVTFEVANCTVALMRKKANRTQEKLNLAVPLDFKRELEEESALTGVPISRILLNAGIRYIEELRADRALLETAKEAINKGFRP